MQAVLVSFTKQTNGFCNFIHIHVDGTVQEDFPSNKYKDDIGVVLCIRMRGSA